MRHEVRVARPDEFAQLISRMEASGGEVIDLTAGPCWVALCDGQIVGMLAARPVFQLEPLLVFSGNKIRDSRAALGLYRAAEAWIGNRANGSGVHWFFCITRSQAVMGWAKRLGWFRQYRGAQHYIKHL